MKYKTGSGQREAKDNMHELEQAACDYAGREVILGELYFILNLIQRIISYFYITLNNMK